MAARARDSTPGTTEHKAGIWAEAFAENGLDPAFYTHRQRRTDEVFPWDHITAAVRKNFLFQDFRQSLEGQIRVDCRLNCFACGILPTFSDLRRDQSRRGLEVPGREEPEPSQRAGREGNRTPVAGD